MPSLSKRIAQKLSPRLGYYYIRLLRMTMRLEWRNREAIDRARSDGNGTYIMLFWHSRFVMMRFAYHDDRLVSLSSRHRDSVMLAWIMSRFGVQQAWGSTRKGGSSGLRQVLRYLRDGYDIAWTPDGPLGPPRVMQGGVVTAAKLSQRPIIPVTFAARPGRRLPTWDDTMLPYPFSRGVFVYGDPIYIPRSADEGDLEEHRRRLQQLLDRMTDEADTSFGIGPEAPRPDPGEREDG